MRSGIPLGDPKRMRIDTDTEIHSGDWMYEKSIQTECGERWWVVISARPVKPRSVLPRRYRYALSMQERQTPTSDDPTIPEDFPTEPGMTHSFKRHYRPRGRRRR